MTGFIKKLFRLKPKDEETIIDPPSSPVRPARKDNGFYLDSDDARTLGNLEYMRSSKVVRRTFPKAKLGKDNETIRSVSSNEQTRGSMPITPAQSINPSSLSQASRTEASERRSADSSMDIFRKMAKDIKKG